MEKLDPKTDGRSKDIVQENIEKLKTMFPEIFSEDKVDFTKLQETLGDYIDDQEERYNFAWFGKSQARRIAQMPSTGTLRPCKEESKNWNTTQNLFVEGDNLEVLKLLQKSYHKKVKMISIDPPYNTGGDFIYPDNYRDNLDTYLAYTGQKDREGYKFSSNTEQSGRYHTNWLNMMYPRLKLARNLLRDDGVIFISIDDNEVSNLRKICDEIFGEENFVDNLIWKKIYGGKNDSKWFLRFHDYVLVYAKNKKYWFPNLLPRTNKQNDRYKNPDNDLRGPWKSGDFTGVGETASCQYEIKSHSGKTFLPPQGKRWIVNFDSYEQLLSDNRIWFGATGENVPSIKRFLSEVKDGVTQSTILDYSEVGHSDGANRQLKQLLGGAIFDYPKPVEFSKRLVHLGSHTFDIILDFFSGSSTTAHAVMQLNAEDSGHRKFIMVQLPEPCDEKSEAFKAGYKTIAEIGKKRIRCAGDKILAENENKEGIKNLDVGFKVFKLDSSNIKAWDADFDNLKQSLFDAVYNIKEDRKEEDVLYELLLKYGLDLTLPIEERTIGGKTVFSIGFGALVICLDSDITLDVVEGIGKLKDELEPEIMRVVFKDSGFKDDVVKTNAIQILKQYDIEDVKSL